MTVSSEPGDVQAERASRVDNMLVDFTDRAVCALERFLSEHKESGSAVMPKWFATLVLVIHAIAQWRGVKPMEFDRTSNEWETKRPNMRQRLEQERTDEDKLDAAYVKHKTNPGGCAEVRHRLTHGLPRRRHVRSRDETVHRHTASY